MDIKVEAVETHMNKVLTRQPGRGVENLQLKVKSISFQTLDVRKKKLATRLDSKSTIINEMLLSRANAVAVREDIGQLDDLSKMVEALTRHDSFRSGLMSWMKKHLPLSIRLTVV